LLVKISGCPVLPPRGEKLQSPRNRRTVAPDDDSDSELEPSPRSAGEALVAQELDASLESICTDEQQRSLALYMVSRVVYSWRTRHRRRIIAGLVWPAVLRWSTLGRFALSCKRFHDRIVRAQRWWRIIRMQLRARQKEVEQEWIKVEKARHQADCMYIRVRKEQRTPFIIAELTARRFRHLAFLEHFEANFREYKTAVTDWRFEREAILAISGVNIEGSAMPYSIVQVDRDNTPSDVPQRSASAFSLPDDAAEVIKMPRCPIPPPYVSYMPSEDEVGEMVNRCKQNAENSLVLAHRQKGIAPKAAKSNADDKLILEDNSSESGEDEADAAARRGTPFPRASAIMNTVVPINNTLYDPTHGGAEKTKLQHASKEVHRASKHKERKTVQHRENADRLYSGDSL